MSVDQADSSNLFSRRRDQLFARVEADVWRPQHQRIECKSRILRSVVDDHNIVLHDRVGSEGNLPTCLARINTNMSLEKLTVAGEQ